MSMSWGEFRGEHDPETLGALSNLALAQHKMGELTSAQLSYEKALKGYLQVWGPEPPRMAIVQTGYAELKADPDYWLKADRMFQLAEASLEKTFSGTDHLAVANHLFQRGVMRSRRK